MLQNDAAAIEQRVPQCACFVVRVDDDAVVQAVVVLGSCLRVGEDLISRLDGVEPDLCAGMRVPVRVMAHGKRAIRFLDVVCGSGGRYTQDVVEIFQISSLVAR